MTKKTQILAVDDEPIIGESIATALEAPHRVISVAENGDAALALVANENFDVVITDHRMPKAGGLELIRRLRQQNYRGKVIVLSGHLSPANIGTYEDLDIDEVLAKPCDFSELREIVSWLEDEE